VSGRYEERLAELREELEKGRHALAELDARRRRLEESMLRIAGAVQVLEEMVGEGEGTAAETAELPSPQESDPGSEEPVS
jgi:hypothetical protein